MQKSILILLAEFEPIDGEDRTTYQYASSNQYNVEHVLVQFRFVYYLLLLKLSLAGKASLNPSSHKFVTFAVYVVSLDAVNVDGTSKLILHVMELMTKLHGKGTCIIRRK